MGAKLTRGGFVKANFMCQLDSSIVCSVIWSNIILSISVRFVLDEINI